jgi:hypothetical protein
MRAIQTNAGGRLWVALFGMLCVSTTACTPTDVVPDHIAKRLVQPDCMAGYCVPDSDPFPDSVGVYAGANGTADVCTNDEFDDLDLDGINDQCEVRLATAFEPTLLYASNDSVNGEPAYAVRPLGTHNGHYMVLILYMLSEYIDLGTNHCEEWGLTQAQSCGHYGDSESITLRVRYEAGTEHWVVDAAWYSQHEYYGVYCKNSNADDVDSATVHSYHGVGQCDYGSGDDYPPHLAYTANPGGAPYAYASYWKHANYATAADCNVGTPRYFLGFEVWHDSCPNNYNSYLVDIVGPTRNVGSSGYHTSFLDCTESEYYVIRVTQGDQEECYWSGNTYGRFGGWQGVSPMSDPNSYRLNGFAY